MKKLISILCVVAVATMFAVAEQTAETTLSGKLGCGHCEYHVTKDCSAVFKTAEGKTYVIDNPTKEVMDARFDGNQVKVAGKVTEKDGVQHVQASKQELVK